MNRIPMLRQEEHTELYLFAEAIKARRYFRKIPMNLLLEMLRLSQLVMLTQDEQLVHEGDKNPPEMYILLHGSLMVTSQGEFISRLESPGDVVGEQAILSPEARTMTVTAEVDSRVLAFPNEVFRVAEEMSHIPAIYLSFASILAEKLRITEAQAKLRRNARPQGNATPPCIAIVDIDSRERRVIRGTLSTLWKEMKIVEYASPKEFIETPAERRFDLIILDPLYDHDYHDEQELLEALGESVGLHNCPVFAVSEWCNDESNREKLAQMGVGDFLGRPYSTFDLRHKLSAFKVAYYRQRELEQVEHAADTDRLTNLANRRRMDEFLDALVTLYPEERQPFSLIITDVDNFKHYNDTHGHQMGDVVLASIAAILKRSVRRGDLAARFGGEEFVVLLPKCDKPAAFKIAEKLRQAVEEEEIPYQEQQPSGNLTATFGVATYPFDAENVDVLLKRADECLYQGKEAGRNVVIGAEMLQNTAA